MKVKTCIITWFRKMFQAQIPELKLQLPVFGWGTVVSGAARGRTLSSLLRINGTKRELSEIQYHEFLTWNVYIGFIMNLHVI